MNSATTEIWTYCPRCGHKVLLQLTFKKDRVIEIVQIYHTRLAITAREKAQKEWKSLKRREGR